MGSNCGCGVQGNSSFLWIILIFCICPCFSGGIGSIGGDCGSGGSEGGFGSIWIILLLCCCCGGHHAVPASTSCGCC